jgi:hypothetical protein
MERCDTPTLWVDTVALHRVVEPGCRIEELMLDHAYARFKESVDAT